MKVTSKPAHLKSVPDDYHAAPGTHQLPTHISIENLSLKIDTQIIFDKLSLPIYENRINTLIGPSGCGKSSLLNCITRLSDYNNSSLEGKIILDNNDLLHKKTDLIKLRRKVGMIFQKPVPFPMSIRKNFALPLKEHGVRNTYDIEQKMENALRAVGLWKEISNRIDTRADKLSGGQQQRLCIARVLALEPKAILMDEPCSSLDPMATAIVEELIVGLKEKYTIFLVTHNLAQAKRIADFVAFMWYHDGHGRLIEHNHADVIFEKPSNPITAAYVQGLTE
ncbi:MAG: phosphate ABC transporter ATP-binding protein [Gammaproteobacteria bacterium]|nr:phosphate ABC transporter ATP-binding protein [Gammaproteobacteria bacterium]